MFVIPSASGVKYYEFNEAADVPAEVAGQPGLSAYGGITIEGDTLYYRAYTEDGSLYDSFAIRKGEEEVSAVQQVIDMIEPFRDGVTLEDEAAVTAAREAYNALTAEEQEQVTNLDVLVQAEEMIRTLKGLAEKETVRVSDKDAFLAALANENVGTIEVEGVITIGVYGTGIFGIENNTWEDQWQAVNHDVIIRGVTDDAELERLGLVVGNDATLVLEDIYLYANHKNSASSEDPLNCVEVNRGNLYVNGSTSIELGTNGSCKCSTTHGLGTNKQHGHAIALTGTGNVYINTTGNITGKYEAVYSSLDTDSNVVIQNGNVSSAGGDTVIACQYDLEMNGGSAASIIAGNLELNGGTVGSSDEYPLDIRGEAYITGGTVGQNGSGKAIRLGDNAVLSIRPVTSVSNGGTSVSLAAAETTDGRNVSVAVDTGKFGENGAGMLYALPANTMQAPDQIVANREGELETTFENGTLKAVLSREGLNYVYGKYQITGGSLMNAIDAGSNTSCWIYNQYQRVYNVPVESVTVSAQQTVAGAGGTLKLRASAMPGTALDNKITWTSDHPDVAAVEEDGTVTGLKSGTAVITGTAPFGAKDSVTVYICEPQIEGADTVTADVTEENYQLAGLDGLPAGTSVRWTLENNTLGMTVSSDGTLSRTANTQEGTVTLKAAVYENGMPTSAAADKEISVEANLVTAVEIQGADETAVKEKDAEPFQLTAEVLPAGAITGGVTWTSSDDTVAMVDESGLVTVRGIGSAVITASAGGVRDSVTVVVPELTGSSTAYVGQENAVYQLRGTEDLPGAAITYHVDDEAKAKVSDDGILTLLEAGKVTVTARASWNSDTDNPQEFSLSMEVRIFENEDMYLAGLAEEKMMALPSGEAITAENKEEASAAVSDADTAYELLTDTQKSYVSEEAVQKLEDAKKALALLEVTGQEKAEAERICAAIEALPDPVSLEDEADVTEIRAAYDRLTDNGKLLVENYDRLTAAEEQIAQLKADAAADAKAAAAVEALIEALPDTEELTLENADAAEEALKAYEALTDAQKKLVSEEYSDKLEAALEQIAKLEQAEADKDAADKVDQMILALPAEITLADEQTVTAAREAYDSLTPEQKPYVQNLEQLEQAEKTIADLKEADRNAAQNVMDAIDAFGDAISLDDKEALQAVKGQYEKLTDVQKQLVTNYDRLEQLLDQLARLEKEESDKDAAKEAEEIIDALPDEITLQDEAAVNAAREAYDALTEGQKAYVGNLEKLLQAEARIVSLKGSADHTGNHISTGNNASAGTGGAGAGDGQSRNPGADEKAVQTGDPSPLMLWTALALAEGTAAAAGLYFRRKRKL